MQPLITPARMNLIDRAAPQPLGVLIGRAGWQVARQALAMLDQQYGARVLVVVGKGNNGADGKSAADHLARRGVFCHVADVTDQRLWPDLVGADRYHYDLIIDAAYGTGFRGSYQLPEWLSQARWPSSGSEPQVLAVDIPSGVDGLTGATSDQVLPADCTVSFVSLKPGHVFEPGRSLAGDVKVVDIGLEPSQPVAWCLEPADVKSWPRRNPTDHKWNRAVRVVGGAPTMLGAPSLTAAGVLNSNGGYAAVSIPQWDPSIPVVGLPTESVVKHIGHRWADQVLADLGPYSSVVVGPGLAATDTNIHQVQALVRQTQKPLVLDAGAIDAVAADPTILVGRETPGVLTPHQGELDRLSRSVGLWTSGDIDDEGKSDPITFVVRLAEKLGAVVVAKGPTTVIAGPDPSQPVLVSVAGDHRLATAGTGDVLAGIIGTGLASGLAPLMAAGLAVEIHGRAARRGNTSGFVASDLPPLVAEYLSQEAQ